jgi:tRNA U34 5-methylaminomethyl-2-thiouridine-forming methyltransferase MnmC
MSEHLKIIITSDGSHSLLNTSLNETYHSHHGALQESLHVFIKNGLEYFAENSSSSMPVRIFEVGFGTGLNALLALQFSQLKNVPLHYTSIESFPLDEPLWSSLNYADALKMNREFEDLHRAEWNVVASISSNFRLHKIHGSLQEVDLHAPSFDVIFFDAFAPSKQPEMWELSVLQKVVNVMAAQSVFVTYCAKGQLKRDLKSLGLKVETLAGPPGKKEMVRGLKI